MKGLRVSFPGPFPVKRVRLDKQDIVDGGNQLTSARIPPFMGAGEDVMKILVTIFWYLIIEHELEYNDPRMNSALRRGTGASRKGSSQVSISWGNEPSRINPLPSPPS